LLLAGIPVYLFWSRAGSRSANSGNQESQT
jgi:hypothetical protein